MAANTHESEIYVESSKTSSLTIGGTTITDLGQINPNPDGGLNISGPLNMNGYKVTNVANPTNPQDVSTKSYTDTKLSLSGGSMTGDLNMGPYLLTTTRIAASGNEIPNKTYVDTKVNRAGDTITGDLTVAQNMTVGGNLTVNGVNTTIDTVNLVVENPLVSIGAANISGDLMDLGQYGTYNNGGVKYFSIFRSSTDNKVKFVQDMTTRPANNKVNLTGTIRYSDIMIGGLETSSINLAGTQVTATANELNFLSSVTPGIGRASGAVVLDSSRNITGISSVDTAALLINSTPVTSSAVELNKLTGATATTTEFNRLAGTTPGAATPNKALIVDNNRDIGNIAGLSVNQITLGGTLITASAAAINALANASISAAELSYLTGITPGTATASKALIVDSTNAISGINTVKTNSLYLGTPATEVTSTAAELNRLQGVTPGTTSASKALVVDSASSITGLNNVRMTKLTIGGVDVDATSGQINALTNVSGVATASAALVLDSMRSAQNINSLTANTVNATFIRGLTDPINPQDASTKNYTDTKLDRAGGAVTGALSIGTNLTVGGDLIVNGNMTSISTANMAVSDNLISLAEGNTSNTLQIGQFGTYNDGVQRYCGIYADSSRVWNFFHNLTLKPDTAVSTGSGYALAGINCGLLTALTINTPGNLTVGGNVITTGNMSAAAITSASVTTGPITAAQINATSVVASGNASASSLTVSGAITGATLTTTGAVASSAINTGPVVATSLNSGPITSTGGVTTDNVTASNQVHAAILSATGAVTSASLQTGAITATSLNLGASGPITAGAITNASVDASGLVRAGALSATGIIDGAALNVTGRVTSGSVETGSIITTGITSSGPINVTGGLNMSGALSAGAITAASVTTTGAIQSGANLSTINGGNISSAGTLSAVGAITGASVSTGAITASGDVITTGSGNIRSNGTLHAVGAITGASLDVGPITGTSAILAGVVVGVGVVSNGANIETINGGYIKSDTSLIANGAVSSASVSTGAITSTSVTTGAITAGAITGTSLAATGNVSGTSLSASGNVSGTSLTITGLSTLDGGLTSKGNVITTDSGNIVSSGGITATGAITGASLTTTGGITSGGAVNASSVTSSGVISGASLSTPGLVTAGGVRSNGTIETTSGHIITGGSLTSNDITTGAITAGSISATSLTATGAVSANSVTTPSLSATSLTAGAITGTSLTSTGAVNAVTVTASGLVSAGSVSSTGTISGQAVNVVGSVTTDGLSANSVGVVGNITTSGAGDITSGRNITAAGTITGNTINSTNATITSATATNATITNGTIANATVGSLTVNDNLVAIAANNTANALQIGHYGTYNDGTQKYCGTFKDPVTHTWTFFHNLITEPTTSVSPGYTVSPITVGNVSAAAIAATGAISGASVSSAATITATGDIQSTAGSVKTSSNFESTASDCDIIVAGQGKLRLTGTSIRAINGGSFDSNGSKLINVAAGTSAADGVNFSQINAITNIIPGVVTPSKALIAGASSELTGLSTLTLTGGVSTPLILFDGTLIIATGSEINKLAGVNATTAELNKLSGLTSSTAELNKLTGATATTTELNKLSGLTSSTAELNKLAGVTASATDIDVISGMSSSLGTAAASKALVLDALKDVSGINDFKTKNIYLGSTPTLVTATATELNVLSGITATTAQLNALSSASVSAAELAYLTGVTPGTALPVKSLILDSNKDIGGINTVKTTSLFLGSTPTQVISTAGELNTLAGVTPGDAAASKALVLNSSLDVSGISALSANQITSTIVTGLADPTNDADASNKRYTDTKLSLSGGTVTGPLTVGNNMVVTGNFTVNGTNTVVNTVNLSVSDNLVSIATSNIGNSLHIGQYGTYNDGTQRFCGIYADPTNVWNFFYNLSTQPTTMINSADPSYLLAPIRCGSLNATSITTGAVNATGTVSAPTINTANITTTNVTASGTVSAATLTASGNVSGATVTSSGLLTTAGLTSSAAINTTGSAAINAAGPITAASFTTAGNITAATGNVIANSLSSNGGNIFTNNGGNISSSGNLFASGNISTPTGSVSAGAGVIAINGSSVTTTGGGNFVSSGTITSVGDIRTTDSGDIRTTGTGAVRSNTTIAAVGAITGASVTTTGAIVAGTTLTTGGNVNVTGSVTATGAVSAAAISCTGLTSAGGISTTSGNITSAGTMTAASDIVSSGNISTTGAGSSIRSKGTLIADGAISGLSLSTGAITTTGVTSSGNVTAVNINAGGTLNAVGAITGASLTVSGAISGGSITVSNLNTTGITSSGNIATSGTGNISSATTLSAVGAITGASVSASGNMTAGGSITATGAGNIETTGTGNIISKGTLQADGAISGASVASIGAITAGGNITTTGTGNIASAGTITSAGIISTTGGANINSSGGLSAVGSVTSAGVSSSGNIITTGTGLIRSNTSIESTGQIRVTGTGSISTFSGAIASGGTLSAVGNIAGGAAVSASTSLSAGTTITSNGTITATNASILATGVGGISTNGSGNIATTGTGNISSKGTLTSVGNISTSAGNISATAGNISASGSVTSATVTATGAITGAGVTSTVGDIKITGVGNISTASGDISSAGTLNAVGAISGASLSVGAGAVSCGAITATTIATTGITSSGSISATGITSSGGISVTGAGNISTANGNISAAGAINATGSITGASLSVGSGSITCGGVTSSGNISTTGFGTITSAGALSGASISSSGNIETTGSGNILTSGSGNISSAGTLSAIGAISSNASITGATLVSTGNISGQTLTLAGTPISATAAQLNNLATAYGSPGVAIASSPIILGTSRQITNVGDIACANISCTGINMNTNEIINLKPPTTATSAATKLYVDNEVATKLGSTGGTVSGALITSDLTVAGNFATTDNLISIASNNTLTNTLKIGHYGTYYDASQAGIRYCGIYKDPATHIWNFFHGLATEPTNTDLTDSFVLSPINVGAITASSLTVGGTTITATPAQLNALTVTTGVVTPLTAIVPDATSSISALGNINMTGTITGLQDSASASSAVTKNYVDTTRLALAGGTMTGALTTPDLTVNGHFSTDDNLITIAASNTTNTGVYGLFSTYNDGATKYRGAFQDASHAWNFFHGLTVVPPTAMSIAAPGYIASPIICGALTTSGAVTAASLTLGGTAITATAAQINALTVTTGVAVASSALVVSSARNVSNLGTVGCGAITSTGTVSGTSLTTAGVMTSASLSIGGNAISAAQAAFLSGATAGAITVGKVVVSAASTGNVSGLGTVGCGAITSSSTVTATGLVIGGNTITATQAGFLSGSAAGASTANKVVVAGTGGDITSSGALIGASLTLGGTPITTTAAQINALGSVVPGTASASAPIVLDASKNVTGVGTITATRIAGLTDPTSAQDAATKNYVDSIDNGKLSTSGGTLTGTLTTADLVVGGNFTINDNLLQIGANNTAADTARIGIYVPYNNSGVKYSSVFRDPATGAWNFKQGLTIAPGTNDFGTVDWVDAPITVSDVTATGVISVPSISISGNSINATTSAMLSGATAGTAAASKVLVLDASRNITNINNLTSTGTVTVPSVTATTAVTAPAITASGTLTGANLTVGGNSVTPSNLAYLVGAITAGTVSAGRMVVAAATTGNLAGLGTLGCGAITSSGTLTATDLNIGGNAISAAQAGFLSGATAGTVTAGKAVVAAATTGNVSGLGTVGCGAITSSGTLTATDLNIGGNAISATQAGFLSGATAGASTANKVVVAGSGGSITASGVLAGASLTLGGTPITTTAAQINALGSVVPGTASASAPIVLDASKNVTGVGTITATKIAGLTDPTAAQDAATKNYVDVAGGGKLSLTGGTLTGTLTTADLVVGGNFTINDNLLQIGANNTVANTARIGIYVPYNSSGVKYSSVFRDPATGAWNFKQGLTIAPGTNDFGTVDWVDAPITVSDVTASGPITTSAALSCLSASIGGNTINATTSAMLSGATAGTAAASKVLVLDASRNITNINNLASTGTLTSANLTVGGNSVTPSNLAYLVGAITAGTVSPGQMVVSAASTGNLTGLGTVGCGAITSSSTVTATGLVIGGNTITATQAGFLSGSTAGASTANKVVVAGTGGNITSSGALIGASLTLGGTPITTTAAQINALGSVIPGTASASAPIVLDASKNVTGVGTITATKIAGLTDPTAAQDAATKNYVDNAGGGKLSLTGGTLTGTLTTADLVVGGNFTINDNLLQIGADNITANTARIGIYVPYNSSGVKYSSVFRDPATGAWNFKQDLTIAPGTEDFGTVDWVDAPIAVSNVTASGAVIIGGNSITSTEAAMVAGSTSGTAAASKVLVLDASRNITNINNLTSTGTLTSANLTVGGNSVTPSNLAYLVGAITAGTVSAGRAIVAAATTGNLTGLGTLGCGAITSSGTLTATDLNIGGNAITATQAGFLSGSTAGASTANKVVVAGSGGSITASGVLAGASLTLGGTPITTTAAQINALGSVVPGTASASAPIVLDASKNVTGVGTITATKIAGLTDPTAAQEAATKNYVDVAGGGKLNLTGGTLTGTLTTADLVVGGNFTINDNLLQIGATNTVANTARIGIYVPYNSSGVKYSSIFRDPATGAWNFKQGLTIAPGTNDFGTVDWVDAPIRASDVTASGVLTVGSSSVVSTEVAMLSGATAGAAIASKVLVIDSSRNISNINILSLTGSLIAAGVVIGGNSVTSSNFAYLSNAITAGTVSPGQMIVAAATTGNLAGLGTLGCGAITSSGSITSSGVLAGASLTLGGTPITTTAAQINALGSVVPGTASASAPIVLDASKNVTGVGTITATKIAGLTDPIAAQEAATKNYVDVAGGGKLNLTGGTLTGTLTTADLVVGGNFTINDNLLQIGATNTAADTARIGIYVPYNSSGVKYSSVFRDPATGAWNFKQGLTIAPGTNDFGTVDWVDAPIAVSNVTASGAVIIGGNSITSTEAAMISGATAGTAAASKVLVLDASRNITNVNNLTSTGTLTSANLTVGGNSVTPSNLAYLVGAITAGTVSAGRAIIAAATTGNLAGLGTLGCGAITSSGAISGTNITASGVLSGASLTLGGTAITATAAQLNNAANAITTSGGTITGTLTTTDLTVGGNFTINETLIQLGASNTLTNTTKVGFYTPYNAGSGVRYSSMFREPTTGAWTFTENLSIAPSPSGFGGVDWSIAPINVGTVSCTSVVSSGPLGCTSITATGAVSGASFSTSGTLNAGAITGAAITGTTLTASTGNITANAGNIVASIGDIISTIGNITAAGSITAANIFVGGNQIAPADAAFISGLTAGTASASKMLVVDASRNIANIGNITSTGTISSGGAITATTGNITATAGSLVGTGLTIGGNTVTAATAAFLSGTITAGTVTAGKAIVAATSTGNLAGLGTLGCGAITSSGAISGTNITASGVLSGASLTLGGTAITATAAQLNNVANAITTTGGTLTGLLTTADLTVGGNLTINENLIQFGALNTSANTAHQGLYVPYFSGSLKYSGLYRSLNTWYFFDELTTAPLAAGFSGGIPPATAASVQCAQLIATAGITCTGTINGSYSVSPSSITCSGAVSFTGTVVVPTPTVAGQAANKAYVDAAMSGGATVTAAAVTSGTGLSNTVEVSAAQTLVLAGSGATVLGSFTKDVVIVGGTGNYCSAGTLQSCILGGKLNTMGSTQSAIIAGLSNNLSYTAVNSVIVGGNNNEISSGNGNVALAGVSTVVNTCNNCVALGPRCNLVSVSNVFMWNSNTTVNLGAPASNTFVTRAMGGYYLYTDASGNGVSLAASGTSWGSICDRNMKENIVELNVDDTLDKVMQLPIYQFNYKNTDPGLICRGPIAQEWHELFPSAKDPLKIDTLDLDGITLAAVKGLANLVMKLTDRVSELEALLLSK